MATAKKLEFQAERKAAAWQGGKPQPAPLPADVHAATCLVDSDGEAARTAYPVFPGIEIAYHDVHAASAATQRACAAGCLEIHHCREGRIAYPYGDACFFLAPDCLSCFLEDVEVRPSALIEKFCADGACFVTRSSPGVAHIFSELYSVPEGIRKGYFKVKILELLLFLSAFPIQAAQPQHGYSLSQVQLAEQIGAYLLQNTERRLTVAELSRYFGASATLINSSFRGVYGMSPAAFLRAQKMHSAARLLRRTDRTVLDIAGQFGYDNGSKFAKAFRDVIGVSPNAYRSGIDCDSCAPETSVV